MPVDEHSENSIAQNLTNNNGLTDFGIFFELFVILYRWLATCWLIVQIFYQHRKQVCEVLFFKIRNFFSKRDRILFKYELILIEILIFRFSWSNTSKRKNKPTWPTKFFKYTYTKMVYRMYACLLSLFFSESILMEFN